MVDGQGTPEPWKVVRTPKAEKAQTKNYLSVIGINFPTPSPTTEW